MAPEVVGSYHALKLDGDIFNWLLVCRPAGGPQAVLQSEGGRVQLRHHAVGDAHGQAALQGDRQTGVHGRGGDQGLPSCRAQELTAGAG